MTPPRSLVGRIVKRRQNSFGILDFNGSQTGEQDSPFK